MDLLWSDKIRSRGRDEHDQLAKEWRALDKNGGENDRDEENISSALDVDLAQGGLSFPRRPRCVAKIIAVDKIKDQKQGEKGERPGKPAIPQHPRKWHALEIAEKKRWTHRGEAAAE